MVRRYVPQPVDISDVELPKELNELIEKMAENVHEVITPELFKDKLKERLSTADMVKLEYV